MNPNQGRESAYVTSRVKDLSLITNTPDYVGCFACITPKAHSSLNEEENVTYIDANGNISEDHSEDNKVYLPQLVRDVDTLTELFGDPRIDPVTYKDLYAIRTIIQNGFACYVAKVKSGQPYTNSVHTAGLFNSEPCVTNEQLDDEALNLDQLKGNLQAITLFNVSSSLVGTNKLTVKLIPVKPYSVNQVYLEITFTSKATENSDENVVASTRVLLVPDIRNIELLRTINSYLGGDLVFSLPSYMDDSDYPTVVDANDLISSDEGTYYCIANVLLYICGLYKLKETITIDEHEHETKSVESTELLLDNFDLVGLDKLKTQWTDPYKQGSTFTCNNGNDQEATLEVSQANYVRSFSLYKAANYRGTFISDLSSDVTVTYKKERTIYIANSYINVNIDNPDLTANIYYIEDGEAKDGEWPNTNPTFDNTVRATAENATGTKIRFDRSEEPIDGNIIYTYFLSENGAYIRKDEYNNTFVEENIKPEDGSGYEGNFMIYASASEEDKTFKKKLYKATSYVKTNNTSREGQVYYVKLEDGSLVERDENNSKYSVTELVEMPSENRRGLHYIIKQAASSRKDLTCIFTTPYHPCDIEATESESNRSGIIQNEDIFDLNRACNWVAAKGDFADLFEYGNAQALDYSEQSFYCEMYWSWLKWRVVKLVNGLATGSATVIIPATPFVILNALTSYRTKGAFYPVAGDQGGVLPDSCVVLQNPSTKGQRDKLISYRINPIWDTGLRGVQIYGNETLNPQYTDLSAAHIARTIVQIRSRVDAYSETIKFSLNDKYTWGTWINYVSTKILEPIKSLGGLQWYQVDMGRTTSTLQEISNRKIRGQIAVQFVQSLEIIDLEYTVYSSALELEV